MAILKDDGAQVAGVVVSTDDAVLGRLVVEAWDPAGALLVDRAATDIAGRFAMALGKEQTERMFPGGDVPPLHFRVFDDSQLLADTKGTVTWRTVAPATVRILVDVGAPPKDTADPAPLVVRGLVADAVTGPLAGVNVEAHDRILAAGQLRDVQVGSATTDARGRYRIHYVPSAGKVKADLTVRVLDATGRVLAESGLLCHAPTTAEVAVTVGGDSWPGPSDHDTLADTIEDVPLADLDDRAVEFLACSRELPADRVELMRAAAVAARDYPVSSALLYALGSEGMPLELALQLGASPAEKKAAVESAVARNAVSSQVLDTLDADLGTLGKAVVQDALKPSSEAARPSLGQLLGTGVTSASTHQAFLERFVAWEGTAEDFWHDLANHGPFRQQGVTADLQLSLQLALLTQNNLPLLKVLKQRRSAGTLTSLAGLTAFDRDDWHGLLDEAAAGGQPAVPPHIPGDTAAARTERYLDAILEPLKKAFPGRYLRQSIARMPEVDLVLVSQLRAANEDLEPREPLPAHPRWGSIPAANRDQAVAAWQRLRAEVLTFPEFEYAGLFQSGRTTDFTNPIRAGVDRLLTNLGDPDLLTTDLDQALLADGAYDGIDDDLRDPVVRQAKSYQRVYRVAPRSEHVETLLGNGLRSALDIALTSAKRFTRDLGPALGGEKAARRVHQSARHIAATTRTALTALRQSYVETLPWAIGGQAQVAALDLPANLETLFGPQAFCDCEHCRSVYSPAAYLVDLLAFLDNPVGPRPLDLLLDRRPDLAQLPLSCANTNTTIPYIDLVNEVLESYVAKGAPVSWDTGDATAAELRAVPQHVNDAAYTTLSDAVYPMTLPFHRPLAVLRAYLGHLGVDREELLERFRPDTDPWDAARVAESLGMSPTEYGIVAKTGSTPASPRVFYGTDLPVNGWRDVLAKAPEFLRRTGLAFTDLVELVRTWFVNPAQSDVAERVTLSSPNDCDIATTTITNLDDAAFDRIHRFLRLWRQLGWPIADVDRALFALGATGSGQPALNATTLRKLAQLKHVMARLKTPLAEALALWAPIDTWGHDAHFLRLFRNRAVTTLLDLKAFELAYPFDGDPNIKSPQPFELVSAATEHLADHTAVVQAALRITEPQLELIREHAELPEDAPLSLTTLSTVYRRAVLAHRTRLPVADLASLVELSGVNPFTAGDPAATLAFLAVVDRVRRSGMRVETLDYLYRNQLRPTGGPAPAAATQAAVLTELRDSLRELGDELTARDDPAGEDVRAALRRVLDLDVIATAMACLLGEQALPNDPLGYLATAFAAFADPAETTLALKNTVPPTSDDRRQQNLAWIRSTLFPWLRDKFGTGIVVSTLAEAIGLSDAMTRTLLTSHLSGLLVPGGHAIDDFLALMAGDPTDEHRLDHVRLHKAASIVTGLGLTDREVGHLLAHPDRFAGFTFDTMWPPFTSWQRAADLVALRRQLPDGEHTLIDLFELPTPADSDTIQALAAEVTGWDARELVELADGFSLTEEDFRTEVALTALHRCGRIARRLGVGAAALFGWAGAAPDATQAKAVVQAVKARYEHDRWLDVARTLNDGLREAQRTALVDYLLPRMGTQVHNREQLFEHFLIDPGMQSCMLTSRVKQAISSVQLFVQRCLLELEPDVDPEDIDAAQWRWRKLYRVWEANRKVFLYPENWIEPELRQEKSPFFRMLETELMQNELVDEHVEQAYLNYLRRLDEVARLDVRAMHHEIEDDAEWDERSVDRLHVFARTVNEPFRYFYRRFERFSEWTPWESVDLDIGSAPHLITTVHNRRLQLYWSQFTTVPVEQKVADEDDPPPPLYLRGEIRLGWSEYRKTGWTPIAMSPAVSYPHDDGTAEDNLKSPLVFTHILAPDGADLRMTFVWWTGSGATTDNKYLMGAAARFTRNGATCAVDGEHHWGLVVLNRPALTWLNGDTWWGASPLRFKSVIVGNKKILDATPATYDIAFPHTESEMHTLTGYYPFFLRNHRHTYFVHPVAPMKDRVLPGWAQPLKTNPGTHVRITDVLHQPVVFKTAESSVQVVNGGGPTYQDKSQKKHWSPTITLFDSEHRELRFRTFWHPHVGAFVSALNRYGLAGLLTLDNQQLTLEPPNGNLFGNAYDPTENVATPWPVTDVDFSPDGAYSLYNWELFFHAPMLIANRLRQEGRYEEALRWLRYIFDPTVDTPGDTPKRFWRFKPFHDNNEYANAGQMLELLRYTGDDATLLDRKQAVEQQVLQWLDHPFDPHRIARLRLVAYQKNTVMRYIDVLLEWADTLFRRDTIEAINEATQLYVLAGNILGPRPQRIPPRSTAPTKTYEQLRLEGLDVFSNADVQMENLLFPFAQAGAADGTGDDSILEAGRTLYFGTPGNDVLLRYWDQVEDRLFKIRHCMNIEGVTRQLALFEPPIDPAALVRAAAAGADLDSVLDDLFAPMPTHRFTHLLARATDLCAEVKALGAQLLTALERKDTEQLANLHAVQETTLLTAVQAVRTTQIDEAESAIATLKQQKVLAEARQKYFTSLAMLNSFECEHLDQLSEAQKRQRIADGLEAGVALAAAIPNVVAGTSGSFGSPVATLEFGGALAAIGAQAGAKVVGAMATERTYQATVASINGMHQRRWEDWQHQGELAGLEVAQIEEQIKGAGLRKQIAQQELTNHNQQIAHATETEEFLRRKYTNTELYGWLLSQISALYFQAYKLAYDLAKRAERAYRYERGLDTSDFIRFGYWDGLRKGLLAGERLALDLKRLEIAYHEKNRRDYELSRRISLALHDPVALVTLKTTGMCEVEIPETLFDADYPGHFFRRVRGVSLTIPCVTGPYTSINCTLTLLSNRTRVDSSATSYRETPPDDRFRYNFVSAQSIATSHALDDTGLFELNFRDERYLPFEGAGAISRWRIELPRPANAFDFDTISDVILKLDYTARDGGPALRTEAQAALTAAYFPQSDEDPQLVPPPRRLFSMRHDFANAWHRFRHDAEPLTVALTPEHFPYQLRKHALAATTIDLYATHDASTPPTASLDVTPPSGPPPTPIPLVAITNVDPPAALHGQHAFTKPTTAIGTWLLSAADPFPTDVHDLLLVLTYHPIAISPPEGP